MNPSICSSQGLTQASTQSSTNSSSQSSSSNQQKIQLDYLKLIEVGECDNASVTNTLNEWANTINSNFEKLEKFVNSTSVDDLKLKKFKPNCDWNSITKTYIFSAEFNNMEIQWKEIKKVASMFDINKLYRIVLRKFFTPDELRSKTNLKNDQRYDEAIEFTCKVINSYLKSSGTVDDRISHGIFEKNYNTKLVLLNRCFNSVRSDLRKE